MEDLKKKDVGPKPLPPVPMPKVVGVSDGEPPEPDVKEKRDKIREVTWSVFSFFSWFDFILNKNSISVSQPPTESKNKNGPPTQERWKKI